LTGFGAADWKRSRQAQECGVKRIRNGWRRDLDQPLATGHLAHELAYEGIVAGQK